MRYHRLIREKHSFLRLATTLMLTAGFCVPLSAQVNVEIGAGCTLEITNTINLELSGDWTNEGAFAAGNGTVMFNGASGTQLIVNVSGETFHNLAVNKAAGTVQLMSPITVNGSVSMQSGGLNLNGGVLTLGLNASVSETAGNTIYGTTGYVIAVRSLNAPTAENVAGLGIIITSSADLGSTWVKRQHTPGTGGGNSGIKRSFTVIPDNNTGLDATLVFIYDESELNGLTESELTLFRSTDDGATWTGVGGTLDGGNNTITLSGVNSFSMWTAAASSAPLPVQLIEFMISTLRTNTELKWKTETETDSYGFEVERKLVTNPSQPATRNAEPVTSWSKVGFVKGAGISTSPREYSFVDKVTVAGRYAYRLKQISQNGTFGYSGSIETVISPPEDFALLNNYPNPFNPTTTIEYELPLEVKVNLVIYDNLGRQVRTLVENVQPAGYYKAVFDAQGLSSGMYYYRIVAGDFVKVKKLLFVK